MGEEFKVDWAKRRLYDNLTHSEKKIYDKYTCLGYKVEKNYGVGEPDFYVEKDGVGFYVEVKTFEMTEAQTTRFIDIKDSLIIEFVPSNKCFIRRHFFFTAITSYDKITPELEKMISEDYMLWGV